MDLIYDDGSKDLYLQSLTTTIIIKKILEDAGLLPNCSRDVKTIASRAIEAVNNLPLPLLLKSELKRMVLPIMEEMQSWYQYKDEASRVILSHNGMVDLPKSISNMLNDENVSLMQRFKVACDHCLEQEIFDIGVRINFPDNFARTDVHPRDRYYWKYNADRWSLADIWYKIYKGNFHAKLSRKDISVDYHIEGFVQAFFMPNSAGVKYFVEGVSLREIMDCINSRIHLIYYTLLLTPDACIKMFKRLKEDERQRFKNSFAAELLKALLKWPYRNQFLKAAQLLAKNMDSEHFWMVAGLIVKKARYSYEDHNYKGLFIKFWKLGSESKINRIPSVCYTKNLLCDIILMRDEQLAHFLLDNTTEEFKTQYIFKGVESACLQLIFGKQFEAVELFMEVSRRNNEELLVKFQKDIAEYLDSGVPYRFYYRSNMKYLTNEEMRNILQEFISGMDKLRPNTSGISI